MNRLRYLTLACIIAAVAGTDIILVHKRAEQRNATSIPSSIQQERERAATPDRMVYIPGGPCLIGSNDADADDDVKPQRTVFVPSFYMDRTEVTNDAYTRLVPTHTFPVGEGQLPVTNVIYAEAEAYARLAGKRLPTEDEWEKAARGTDGRRYPWGNMWDPERVAKRAHATSVAPFVTMKQSSGCAIGPSRVQPVNSVKSGESPYGCVDMAGNAWEWVQGYYNNNPNARILRGGAVGYAEGAFRTYNRAVEGTTATCHDTGFRCAKSTE